MTGLMPRGNRIAGIRIANRTNGHNSTLEADLVVDASGRRSRTPVQLEALGYGRPPVEEVPIGLAYATQKMRLPADRSPDHIVTYPQVPGRPGGFALIGVEDGASLFTVFSTTGIKMPTSLERMLEFIKPFAPADVVRAIGTAEPIAHVAQYRLPSNRWHRYDKIRNLPDGFLVVGEAVSSFNPSNAQGMTVAALEAIELQNCLGDGPVQMARRFFRAAAKKIRPAWQAAVRSDLALPHVAGGRPFRTRLGDRYVKRVITVAEADLLVAEHFLRVIGMVDSPLRLYHPAVMYRMTTARSVRAA